MITVTIKISYICKCINFAAKIVQGERRTKQIYLFFQPSRSLSYVQAVSKDCLDDENITFRK